MTTTRELLDLFRAIGQHDVERAKFFARRIAQGEERKGRLSAARQLKGSLESTNGQSAARLTQSVSPEVGSVIATGLVQLDSQRSLASIELRPKLRAELQQLVKEWKERAYLGRHGIEPRAKLLFYGPPGCGKSLTAQAMGAELGLPVFVVRFDAIIGAFLGQTAIHLRQLFDFAERRPCVLVLDELDALGKQRGNPLDVGELDRIVIALMQELEHSRPSGIIVATSNLPTHLDAALWRRFDLALRFPSPSSGQLRSFAKKIAQAYDYTPTGVVLTAAASTKSYAVAEQTVLAAVRAKLLRESPAANG